MLETITNIVVFGDSLADVGNANIATNGVQFPSPPYNNGRATNGFTIIEFIAQDLGLENSASVPFLRGGDNFAVGGAGLGTGISLLGAPNIGSQIDIYLESFTPNRGDLFFIMGGSNNILFNPNTNPQILVNSLVDHVSTLVKAGATSFGIFDIGAIEQAPFVRNLGNTRTLAENTRKQYNRLLDTTLDNLRDELGITIYELKSDEIYLEIESNPLNFGFTNLIEPALDTNSLTVQPNAGEFFWWDTLHPTASANQVFAQTYLQQILLPLDTQPETPLPINPDTETEIQPPTTPDIENQLPINPDTETEIQPPTTPDIENELPINPDTETEIQPPITPDIENELPINPDTETEIETLPFSEIKTDNLLNENIYRFNTGKGYLYVGEEERQNILQTQVDFQEDGIAFQASFHQRDSLIAINRFRYRNIFGSYLFATDKESQIIRENYPDFIEEGVAFYVFDINTNQGTNFYRLQNIHHTGIYLLAGEQEKTNMLTSNVSEFVLENIAFQAII